MSNQIPFEPDSANAMALRGTIKIAPGSIVSRTLLQSPSLRATLFAFADGQELTPHSSQRRALVHILEGRCDFLFAGTWHRLEAGALVHLPPGHVHAVRAAGPCKFLLILADEPPVARP